MSLMHIIFQAQAVAAQAEKRQRQFDKAVDEWKAKCGDATRELDSVNAESRSHAAEVYKLRAQLDESHDASEALRRENKNLLGRYTEPFVHNYHKQNI